SSDRSPRPGSHASPASGHRSSPAPTGTGPASSPGPRRSEGASSTGPSATGHGFPSLACPAEPLLGVYEPGRFAVVDTCRWVSGTVAAVLQQNDGNELVALLPEK